MKVLTNPEERYVMSSPVLSLPTDQPAYFGGKPLFSERFRFIKPTLPTLDAVLGHYSQSYANGVITNADVVAQFEREAAAFLGAPYCVAVSSCTSGLMMVLRALKLSGEVLLPSFTFFATGHAVRWNGLVPVFCECDPDTWNINVADIESRITERTSAILAVHLYGNPCAVEALADIAAKHHLKLIYDAAHAFGSRHGEKRIGQFGDAEVFSLSPTKLLVAGEGGLVATGDASIAEAVRSMRNYGDLGAYDPDYIGLNARMSEFNAALGVAGLPLVSSKVNRHNRIASLYTDILCDVPGLRFQKVNDSDMSTYKDYSIHVTASEFGASRDELRQALLAENIDTKLYFYPPMHRQKLYQEFCTTELPATDEVADGILSLPVYESMTDVTVERIATAILRFSEYVRRGDHTADKEENGHE